MATYREIVSSKKRAYGARFGWYAKPSREGFRTPKIPRSTWEAEIDWWHDVVAKAAPQLESKPGASKSFQRRLNEFISAEWLTRAWVDDLSPREMLREQDAELFWHTVQRLTLEIDTGVTAPSKWDIFVDATTEAISEAPQRIGEAIGDAAEFVGDTVGTVLGGAAEGVGRGFGAGAAGAAKGFLGGVFGFLVVGGVLAVAGVTTVVLVKRAGKKPRRKK